MNSEVPQQIINKLIELGRRENIDDPSVSADFVQFCPYEYLGRVHWREWYPVCENLSTDDHIALLKAVVMAMRYSGWDGGSVAPGIWIYNKLTEKVPSSIANEIAQWIIERSDNEYMYFGSCRDRELFINNRQSIAAGTTMLALKLDAAAAYAQRERAQHEIQKQQQEAKVLRLQQKEKNAAEHYLRKIENFELWQQMVGKAEQLDEIARLCLILEYPHMPLLCFPSEWAEMAPETLRKIEQNTRNLLTKRITGKMSPPWVQLCKQLIVDNCSRRG